MCAGVGWIFWLETMSWLVLAVPKIIIRQGSTSSQMSLSAFSR